MASTPRPTFGVAPTKTFQKIAIEEAISTHIFNATTTLPPVEGTAELPYVDSEYVTDVKDRLNNVEARVQAMNEAGVALTVVSLTMPGIEGIFDTSIAVETARKVNDEIYELYTAGPHAERFRAFGCVAMQDPLSAATEAERCVKDLGFVGILINGFSNIGSADQVQYLDEPQCAPFWAKVAELDVPVYIHPRIPSPSQMRAYKGYEFLGGSPWGFGTETATHAIRLMISGLFDKHPNLRIIFGHCGESIPFSINRIDHRLRHFQPHHTPCKLRLRDYWEKNFYITTAGVMDDGTFFDTLKSCGEDRLLWSVDYPYEDYNEIGSWFDNLDLNTNSKAKIGWENARRLLKLE
ncbi:hypothetical protein AbraIFM66950_009263 [Aspergillus brasiliensis]|nr:hypothetical protein AbraIFM66950_009263 [Aspergillus brasiliensis]